MEAKIKSLEHATKYKALDPFIFDATQRQLYVREGEDRYYQPIPVSPLMWGVVGDPAQVYFTGVRVEMDIEYAAAVDVLVALVPVQGLPSSLSGPFWHRGVGNGIYFVTDEGEVAQPSGTTADMNTPLWGVQSSLVQSIFQSAFTDMGRDQFGFEAKPVREAMTKGNYSIKGRRSVDHTGVVNVTLRREAVSDSPGDRLNKDKLTAYWNSSKEISLGGDAPSYFILLAIKPQTTSMTSVMLHAKGGEAAKKEFILRNVRLHLYMKRKV